MGKRRGFAAMVVTAVGFAACGGDSGVGPDGSQGSGRIGVTVSPAMITMAPGAAATANVTIQRANYDAPVFLSTTGAPDEIHASIPSVGAGTETTLTLTASESAPEAIHVGQVGDGTLTDKQVPVPVDTDVRFESIYAGGPTTCALTEAGQAYCWGGGAMIVNQTSPRPVGVGLIFKQLSVGESHACGVTVNEPAYCWGRNFNGELGDGNGGPSVIARVPVAVGLAP